MRIPEVMVVASSRLVPLWVMEGTLFILDGVTRRGGRERRVALVGGVDMVLLGQLP